MRAAGTGPGGRGLANAARTSYNSAFPAAPSWGRKALTAMRDGLSLIELLIAIVVAGMTAVALFGYLTQ